MREHGDVRRGRNIGNSIKIFTLIWEIYCLDIVDAVYARSIEKESERREEERKRDLVR